MTASPFMTFSLHGTLYGVDATFVREVFWLPELAVMAELPDYLVGLVNVRGRVVPVMDLDKRLGYPPSRYRTTDTVIVLEWDEAIIGIIVSEILEVRPIPSEDIEPVRLGKSAAEGSRFASKVATVDGQLVRLLDLQRLLSLSESIRDALDNDPAAPPEPEPKRADSRHFCPEATAEERGVFAERARQLARRDESRDTTGQQPYAVVGLNREYFGVNLSLVQEFSDVGEITAIPCSPPHIVGYMNLRGDIVTLLDMRTILKMPLPASQPESKVIIVQYDGLLAGILVDEVLDLIYLRQADLAAVPASVKALGDGFLKGTAPYEGRMLSLLDLPKVLTGQP